MNEESIIDDEDEAERETYSIVINTHKFLTAVANFSSNLLYDS